MNCLSEVTPAAKLDLSFPRHLITTGWLLEGWSFCQNTVISTATGYTEQMWLVRLWILKSPNSGILF